jgi:hypothetical protein
MKTRTKGTTKTVAEATVSAKSLTPKIQLPPESTNPPHLFILPEDINSEARIVSIENPRYAEDDRYLVCPDRGFYEFTRIAAPKTTPRSWLLHPQDKEDGEKEDRPKGFVTKAADLYIATPIDPIFLLLPALAPQPKSNSSDPAKKLFLAGDDYIERLTTASPDLSSLVRIESLRTRLEKRMAMVCDTVDAGDETMYRLNEEKLLGEFLDKAKTMVSKGLPASMEEKLIRKSLEVPMLSMKRDASSLSELVNEEDPLRVDSGTTTPAETPDTQNTTSTAARSFSEASTAATSFSEDTQIPKITLPPINAPEGVPELLRLRAALFFICSAYLAPHVTKILKKSLSSPSSPMDFEPLDTHLAHLAKLRQDALVARSLGDYSRKRSMNEDDEGLESRAEKKQKKDEEEKRKKAGESRGVRDLKKVNVSGMKKMSDFFKKKV